jgi:DNA-binding NtrC family response regulator
LRRRAPLLVHDCTDGRGARIVAILGEMSAGTLLLRDIDRLGAEAQEGVREVLAARPAATRERAIVSSSAVDLRVAVNAEDFSPELFYRLAAFRVRGT